MEDGLLGESAGGVGMRNQDWLPIFLQKPQAEGTDVPIIMDQEPHRLPGVNEWSTATDALTNSLFRGMADRGVDQDMDTKRLFPDTLYILRGFGMFQVELGDGDPEKSW